MLVMFDSAMGVPSSADVPDPPMCPTCRGTGRVSEPTPRTQDIFDVIPKLIGAIKQLFERL